MQSAEIHFGKQLKLLRANCGISQEELSHLADVHTSYVSKLERGTKSPTLGVILRMAAALGVSGANLIDRVERSIAEHAE
ncbi:helix-turn-helix domain-containing protein [Paracidovorax cattleyae]|uniref:helix-turn-helix domain-containing protein n=1 Tax=Paracidovorax cattleyae TaxID=80868 RepID=UPI000B88D268|nr:helix-turn-helix transcriptional regulator [Paracidovorax cattleyae]MBF9264135.1 helix-turn-helix transcriptional regulator [Paracidovorax cattleyae]